MDATNEVLVPVAQRIREHCDSLTVAGRFNRSGIEGWFKVETIAALRDKVKRVQNKGPDLVLASGDSIELKGATDFNPSAIAGGARKYKCLCLFLGSTLNQERIDSLGRLGVELLGQETFGDGERTWVVGLIRPRCL